MKIDKCEVVTYSNGSKRYEMLKDGLIHHVPDDPNNSDYKEILKQAKEGKIVINPK